MSGFSSSSLECRAQRCQELHTFIIKKKDMTLLQLTQDSITVSTLPHPISMFFLGVSFIISLYLYFELTKVRSENRSIVNENLEIKEKIRQYKIDVDKTVNELSKKVDSRVDKAIETMKKNIGK